VSADLDDLYLTWLYTQVGDRSVEERNPARTHWTLLRQLHNKQFYWWVPNDDNRVEDGRDLRHEFLMEHDIEADLDQMGLGCSFLEMLIGLSRRLAFEGGGHPHVWFWHLLGNLNLTECNDRSRYSHEEVDDRISTVIWRTYSRNGRGGLFPLRRSRKDQREVELWYQMSAYLLEG
jgi:hypothetical protein